MALKGLASWPVYVLLCVLSLEDISLDRNPATLVGSRFLWARGVVVGSATRQQYPQIYELPFLEAAYTFSVMDWKLRQDLILIG